MDSERLDLSSLDPSLDPERWDGLIDGIMRDAAPELARRTAARSSLAVVADWARPALVAAVVLLAMSAAVLLAPEAEPAAPAAGLAETLGLPPTVASWVAEERTPSLSELMLATAEDLR